ncbi:hypothetical protein NPIL_661801, partial [Nephila pilipes]
NNFYPVYFSFKLLV